MSIITFQFGQCGNQIGQTLYSYIYDDMFYVPGRTKCPQSVNNDYLESSKDSWFSVNKKGELVARSILVDTENKVTAIAKNTTSYKFKNVVSKAFGGSANNWACGYNVKSSLLIGEILDSARKEVEKCNFIRSFVNILSAGGGTGSGVGSRVIERLRDEFPNKIIVNCLVLPHEKGEVVTQSYNALHTLAKLYDISDASILFSNDLLLKLCSRNLLLEDASLDNFNDVISQHLAGIFQPLQENTISEPLVELVAHPEYKFLTVYSAPLTSKKHLHYESTVTWQIILSQLEQSLKGVYNQVINDNKECKRLISQTKCLGNTFMTRGSDCSSNKVQFLSEKSYVGWVPRQTRLSSFWHKRPLKNTELSTTLVSNNNYCSVYLNSILEDAWVLFTNGAYVHHYKKFGVNEQDFLQAFERLEGVLYQYRTL